MVKSALFRGDANVLTRCILVPLFQAPSFNIFRHLLDLGSLPGSPFSFAQPGQVWFCSIQNQINGERREIISHLCFKKELCLTGRNNKVVRLPPTVLQIQDVRRWANYLRCIIILRFFANTTRYVGAHTLVFSPVVHTPKPHRIKEKILQWAMLVWHS